jgi:hypothetical protein
MATRTRTRNTAAATDQENEMTEQQNELNELAATEMTPLEQAQTEQAEAAEQSTAPAELDKTVEAAKPEPNQPMTPFQAAKRVNDALAAAGLKKKIQAPMLYIYAGKEKFKTHTTVKITAKGIKKNVMEVDEDSFFAWMEQFVAGAVARANGVKELQAVVYEEDAKLDVAEGHENDGITTDELEEVTEAE